MYKAVEKAHERADTPLMPTPSPNHELALEELADAWDKPGKRKANFEDKTLVIEVQLEEGRSQTVNVTPSDRKDEIKLLSVFSYCGATMEKAQSWTLRSNAKLMN